MDIIDIVRYVLNINESNNSKIGNIINKINDRIKKNPI